MQQIQPRSDSWLPRMECSISGSSHACPLQQQAAGTLFCFNTLVSWTDTSWCTPDILPKPYSDACCQYLFAVSTSIHAATVALFWRAEAERKGPPSWHLSQLRLVCSRWTLRWTCWRLLLLGLRLNRKSVPASMQQCFVSQRNHCMLCPPIDVQYVHA